MHPWSFWVIHLIWVLSLYLRLMVLCGLVYWVLLNNILLDHVMYNFWHLIMKVVQYRTWRCCNCFCLTYTFKLWGYSQSCGKLPCQDWLSVMICYDMPLDRHQVLTKVYSTDCLTLIGMFLKCFNLVFEGNIFSARFHIFACLRLKTLTWGPFSSLLFED